MNTALKRMYENAHSKKPTIILAEHIYDDATIDHRVLRAAEIMKAQGLVADVILPDNTTFVRMPHSMQAKLVDTIMSSHIKTDTKSGAHKMLSRNRNILSAAMVKCDMADISLSGNISTTKNVIGSALKIIGTNGNFASSFFMMEKKERILFLADCAFNIDPNPKGLAQIAINTARSAMRFDIEPKIAFLSFSTGHSGNHKDVERIFEAVNIAKKLAPRLLIDGPLQFDAATRPSVAKIKASDSCVAGEANVLIMPDLNSGNILYKTLELEAGYRSIGPIMDGMEKPVHDLSRNCTVQNIIDTAMVAFSQLEK